MFNKQEYFTTMIRMIVMIGLWTCTTNLSAQDFIYLENPSFEGTPQAASIPSGWDDCGFPRETPPDIQPSNNPDSLIFGNKFPPYHGSTYLAMVARENGSIESVTQRLATPLLANEEYRFRVYLARPEHYLSLSPNWKEVSYTKATILQIFGGNSKCEQAELLSQSTPVNKTEWNEYTFTLRPENDCNWITLEACHIYPTIIPYSGGLFLDNCSPIYPTSYEFLNDELTDIFSILKMIDECATMLSYRDSDNPIIPETEALKRTLLFDRFIFNFGLEEYLKSTSHEDILKDITSFKMIQIDEVAQLIRLSIPLKNSIPDSGTDSEKKKKKLIRFEKRFKAMLNGSLAQNSRLFVRMNMNTLNQQLVNCE